MNTPGPLASRRAGGRNCRPRKLFLLLAVVCLGLCVPWHSAVAQGDSTPDEQGWRELLRQHTDDFATARLLHRQAELAIAGGDRETAREYLAEASELDRRFERAHLSLARIDALAAKSSVAGELWEAGRDHASGFRNQSYALSNVLLTFDAILGVLFIWSTIVLLVRYLPYVHHRLAQSVLEDIHRSRRAKLLWPAVLAPFLAAASWGLVPFLGLALVVVWVHAARRPRVYLATLLVILMLQGAWSRPTSTLLAGTDPGNLASIAERAAYEPPTDALLAWIDRELVENPEDADLLGAKGLLLARRGDFSASTTAFLKNLSVRPDDAAGTNNLAANHFFRGDYERAVAGFQRTVAIDSTRATAYYNLSQAYLQRLFMKEGGDALQQALSKGFAVTSQVERLPRGAVYFVRPRVSESWQLAWRSSETIRVADLLEGQSWWLGVPASHLHLWLIGISIAALIAGLALPRKRLVFECANCGTLACRHCRGEHEGAVLCTDCGSTARRAKSEMVLTTLLRNRQRDAESRYHNRLRKLDQVFPGAGRLVDGAQRRGIVSGILVSTAVVALLLGGAPLRDPWELGFDTLVTPVRVLGLLALLLAYFINNVSRPLPRFRHLQPHPSSSVSLAGLIEGRPPRRIKAGG